MPEFIKCLGFLFEYSKDRIRRLASIKNSGEFMIAEILTSPFSVLFQGRIEEGFEIGWSGVMIETLDVVSGRRKGKTRGDTWVGPSCSLAQSSCASTAGPAVPICRWVGDIIMGK